MPRTSGRALLSNGNFLLLWAAYGVSAIGDHLFELCFLTDRGALAEHGHATTLMARMTFLFFLPFFLLAPINGWLADRLPRRGLMIFADLARFCVMMLFGWMVAQCTGFGSWGPLLPILLLGVFSATFSPARFALLPSLVGRGQYTRANGLMSGIGIIGSMIGFVVGGQLVDSDAFSPTSVYRINGLTFLISATLLAFLSAHHSPDTPEPPAVNEYTGQPKEPLLRALAGGFTYALTHRRVLELILVSSVFWLCGPLVRATIPAVVHNVYGGDAGTVGIFQALIGVGFILGSILMGWFGDALRGELVITWSLFGASAGVAFFAASTFPPWAPWLLATMGGVGIVTIGLFGVALLASFNALLQRFVPSRHLGRVMGLKDLASMAALLLAVGAVGVPGWQNLDHWVGYVIALAALIIFLAGVISLRVRLRRGAHGKVLTFAENLNEFMCKFWYRLRLQGRPTVPRTGPAIVVANHTVSADPLLIAACARYRTIAFMVAAEYSRLPLAGMLMRRSGCIAVRRDGEDIAAFRQALRHLRAGGVVGIFIQGGIPEPGEARTPKDGAALLAIRSGAPIIPVHISGTTWCARVLVGLLHPHRAVVRFGAPIDPSSLMPEANPTDRNAIADASRKILAAIVALAPAREEHNLPHAAGERT